MLYNKGISTHGRYHGKKRSTEGDIEMTKEQLIAQGLTEEQATAVLKLHTDTLDGNYVPKHRFDEINTELKNSKDQLKERDKQIEGLKKFEGDASELKKKVEELEETNKQTATDYANKLAQERKQNAVKLALLGDEAGKPHDVDMVMSLFNLEQITIDESGKIVSGFKEQNETIRKDKSFLFDVKQQQDQNQNKPGWKPTGNLPGDGDTNPPKSDEVVNFGKSLAKTKLGMMGVAQQNNQE